MYGHILPYKTIKNKQYYIMIMELTYVLISFFNVTVATSLSIKPKSRLRPGRLRLSSQVYSTVIAKPA